MKFWSGIRKLLPRQFLSLRMGTRDPLTISAIGALPVAGPPLRQEIAREKEKGGRATFSTGGAEGKSCPACRGNTKVKILNYWCDPVTDIITPADTIEQCDCGWTGLVLEHDRPL